MSKAPSLKAPKRQRGDNDAQLILMHRGSYVSQSALQGILQHVKDHGLPHAFSRFTQRRAHTALGATDTPLEAILKEVVLPLMPPHKPLTVSVQCPMAMLWALARQCQPFRSIMKATLAQHPSSMARQWRLVIYFDGISPQNPLAKGRDLRKVEAVYWSFLEFGPYLSQELFWFCVSASRHDQIVKLPGMMSENIAIILDELFFGARSMRRHGVTIDLSDAGDDSDLVTIFADHAMTLADAVALEEVNLNNGHNATKACPICRNVLDHKSGYAERDTSGQLQPSTCVDKRLWKSHTDDSVRQLLRRLGASHQEWQAGRITKTDLKLRIQMAGYKWNANSIVLHARLNYRAISTLCFDWMHIWCVDGVFARELHALLETIKADPPAMTTVFDLSAYMSRWVWPRQLKSAAKVFETGDFQANASQTLSAAPVLAHYVREVIQRQGRCVAAVASFLLCCNVLELLVGASRGDCPGTLVDEAVRAHSTKHLEAHGAEWWVFKHHMALHVGDMYMQFMVVLACFVHERRHRLVKRFIVDHKAQQGYERHLMEQMTAQHLHDWHEFALRGCRLVEPTVADERVAVQLRTLTPVFPQYYVSPEAKTARGASLWRRDVVLLDGEMGYAAGEVWFHVADRNACLEESLESFEKSLKSSDESMEQSLTSVEESLE